MEKTIWLHVGTGHFYAIMDIGLREHDLEPMFEYKRLGEDNQPVGIKFHSPVREFLDGRFTQFNVNGVGGEVGNGCRTGKTAAQEQSEAYFKGLEDVEVNQVVEESEETALGNRPCLDAHGNELKVGSWVVANAEMDPLSREKLPDTGSPYQIARVEEGRFPKIYFHGAEDAIGWYPAAFYAVSHLPKATKGKKVVEDADELD